ncbi:MAG: glycoside hydrolase family 127 protein [Verrucomicrobiales bacterium]|nr:glycoside hydrolase family 127 protein [Verrucomicrobiales bacterium]
MRCSLPAPARTTVLAALLAGVSSVQADSLAANPALLKVIPVAPPLALPFSPHDVRLLDGSLFKAGQDAAVEYLLSLEPDRFLARFRSESGLKPKAEHYPGWEQQGVSGHSLGHYLSGCAFAWAATDDGEFLRRVNYIVEELAACQEAGGDGYVAAIPNGRKVYAEVAAGNIRSAGFDLNGCWVPNYTMHKLFAGLRDAYRLCGNKQALAVARKLADWFEKTLANLDDAQMQKMMVAEHGGINETFADLYADTGDERYLRLSRRFHHKAILDPLARGEDILPGKHANTQIPKLNGLATRYELTGDPADRAAADFFWDRVVNHHSYVTGGHCDHEYFGPPDQLNDRLSDDTTETCNVYNMLKLTRHIFGWRPESRVADFYERALLNHIRSSQHPDGRVIYNLTLRQGGTKSYQLKYDWFTCCMGTGMENHVRYTDGIYFHDADSLWVNLFIPSTLNWRAHDVQVRQETRWPEGDCTDLLITAARPQEFALRLRRPYWARDGVFASVNGQPVEDATCEDGFLVIRREWRNGDRVRFSFPMSLRTEAMPDNPRRIAVFHGPTLLAADLGPVEDPHADEPFYVPVLLTADRPVTDWLKPVSRTAQVFETVNVGRPREVRLVPFHRLHDRRYTVYFDEYTEADWTRREAELRAEQERQAVLEARTVDRLRIGEMQPERDHNLQGEETSTGEAFGRKWRHAINGGWFGFDLKVRPDGPHELWVTYWGGETGNRIFDILVNGEKVATQRLRENAPGKFYEQTYPIPERLTQGRDKVNVRFQAQPGAWAGGVFDVRLLTPEP